jgi:hypothetical protein
MTARYRITAARFKQSSKCFARGGSNFLFGTVQRSNNFPRMTERLSIVIERIGKTIREAFERLAPNPVPERWDDLIKRLDAEEEARRGTPRGSRR